MIYTSTDKHPSFEKYIKQCTQTKTEVITEWQNFFFYLSQLKHNPELLLTDFFSKKINSFSYINNYIDLTPLTMENIFIPLLLKIKPFSNMESGTLQCGNSYYTIEYSCENTSLLSLNCKAHTYYVLYQPLVKYQYDKNYHLSPCVYNPKDKNFLLTQKYYDAILALQYFYRTHNLKSKLKKWRKFIKLGNLKTEHSLNLLKCFFYPNSTFVKKLIQETREKHLEAIESLLFDIEYNAKKTRIQNLAHNDIKSICSYLNSIGYHQLS